VDKRPALIARCEGVADVIAAARISGPNDETPMPHYEVPVHDRLAAHLRHGGVEAGFDLAMAQDFTVDHSIMVPLHFLTPQMQTPVVPMFINGLVPPLPAAKRCFALGEAVRKAIHRWPQGLRVAVLASGSFSLEVRRPPDQSGRGVWRARSGMGEDDPEISRAGADQ